MNIFELIYFFVFAVGGLKLFQIIEEKAGFWGGALGFFVGSVGSLLLWNLFIKFLTKIWCYIKTANNRQSVENKGKNRQGMINTENDVPAKYKHEYQNNKWTGQ